jgi:hypothetical protein
VRVTMVMVVLVRLGRLVDHRGLGGARRTNARHALLVIRLSRVTDAATSRDIVGICLEP